MKYKKEFYLYLTKRFQLLKKSQLVNSEHHLNPKADKLLNNQAQMRKHPGNYFFPT